MGQRAFYVLEKVSSRVKRVRKRTRRTLNSIKLSFIERDPELWKVIVASQIACDRPLDNGSPSLRQGPTCPIETEEHESQVQPRRLNCPSLFCKESLLTAQNARTRVYLWRRKPLPILKKIRITKPSRHCEANPLKSGGKSIIPIDQLTDQVIIRSLRVKSKLCVKETSIGAKDNLYVAFTRAPLTGSHMTSVRDRRFDPK
jgi:hypothetical protein